MAGEELSKLERDAQANILSIDQNAHDKAEGIVEGLREKLAEHITSDTAPGLLAQLQTAKLFGLQPTNSELSAMAAKSNGDPVAMACLAQLADQSGFAFCFTTAADLEADLKKIMSLFAVPSLYAPDGLVNEALRYAPDEMRYGVPRRPDIVSMTARLKGNEVAPAQLDAMAERWNNAGTVELKKLAPI